MFCCLLSSVLVSKVYVRHFQKEEEETNCPAACPTEKKKIPFLPQFKWKS